MHKLAAVFSLCILMSATSLAAQSTGNFTVNIHLNAANAPSALTDEMVRDVSQGLCTQQTTPKNNSVVCITGQLVNIKAYNDERFVKIEGGVPFTRYTSTFINSVKGLNLKPTSMWAGLSRLILNEVPSEGALEFLVNF